MNDYIYKDKNRNKNRNQDIDSLQYPKQLKSLSQVFLRDIDPVYDMIDFLKKYEIKRVLEIGPGNGALTKVLLEQGFIVTAIEKDERFFQVLSEKYSKYSNFKIINEDILSFNIKEWIDLNKIEPIAIVGNIPYSISSPLMYLLATCIKGVEVVSLMVQKEFADKVLYEGSPLKIAWERISKESRLIRFVGKEMFDPIPKVDSCIIGFSIKDEKELDNDDKEINISSFIKFLKMCFSLKRKKLSNVLKPFIKEDMDLSSIEVDLNKRADALSLKEFIELYKYVKLNK